MVPQDLIQNPKYLKLQGLVPELYDLYPDTRKHNAERTWDPKVTTLTPNMGLHGLNPNP